MVKMCTQTDLLDLRHLLLYCFRKLWPEPGNHVRYVHANTASRSPFLRFTALALETLNFLVGCFLSDRSPLTITKHNIHRSCHMQRAACGSVTGPFGAAAPASSTRDALHMTRDAVPKVCFWTSSVGTSGALTGKWRKLCFLSAKRSQWKEDKEGAGTKQVHSLPSNKNFCNCSTCSCLVHFWHHLTLKLPKTVKNIRYRGFIDVRVFWRGTHLKLLVGCNLNSVFHTCQCKLL